MMERKHCQTIEFKFDAGIETMSFDGYGAVFGNVDAYGDVIQPGAFAQYLSDVKSGKQRPPAMLLQHGGMGMTSVDEMPIGKWQSMSEDGYGLKMSGQIADTTLGRDVYKLLKMDALQGLSIGYIAKEATPRSKPDEPRRTLKRIDLVEVSVVTRPANDLARVSSVKSIEEMATLNDAQDYLCAQGMSKTQAVAVIARIKSIGPGNPVGADGGPGNPVAELSSATLARALSILKN